MIAEYKGANGQTPAIPAEVMDQMQFRILIGHAGPNRSTVLCRAYAWNAKNNRWTFDYALVHARVKLRGGAEVLVATLYEFMAIVDHPLAIVPLANKTKGAARA